MSNMTHASGGGASQMQGSPQVLTFEEMKQKYWGEWLLIDHAELDEEQKVVRGRVLAHSTDRDEIDQALPLREGKMAAVEYVGPIPDDYAVMF